jgi:hypothetical protein
MTNSYDIDLPYRQWTNEERDVVRQLFPTIPSTKIGAMLNRTPDAIRHMAENLNVNRMSFWTEERTQFLRDNWIALSASNIANKLGCSRNSIISKVRRLGFPSKRPEDWGERRKLAAEDREKRQRIYIRKKSPPQSVELPVAVALVSLRISLFDLNRHHCRWPYDEEVGISYCGHQVIEDGQSFCPDHYHMAYRPTNGRRSRYHALPAVERRQQGGGLVILVGSQPSTETIEASV